MTEFMDLNKYIKAQEYCIDTVKSELTRGKKETHWIWFIFPQLKGLGKSIISDYYGLKSLDETREYYKNKYLKKNLDDCLKIVMNYSDISILHECLGDLDTVKIHSCATLFYLATQKNIFVNILNKFFNGSLDMQTVLLLDTR